MLLIDAIRKSSLKALYLPDRKRILLDAAFPRLKHRWNEAHEIGHSVIPWHEDVMLGDNACTLSPGCREQIEAEANFAAGRLLFLRDRFEEEARSIEPSIKAVNKLKKTFGNTLSTTLYRFVESAGLELPLVGLVTDHPHVARWSDDFDPLDPCRHFIQSPAFERRFGTTSPSALFSDVAVYCGAQRGGPLGEGEITLMDDNSGRHCFHFETFFNRYDALTLGRYIHPGSACRRPADFGPASSIGRCEEGRGCWHWRRLWGSGMTISGTRFRSRRSCGSGGSPGTRCGRRSGRVRRRSGARRATIRSGGTRWPGASGGRRKRPGRRMFHRRSIRGRPSSSTGASRR